MNLYRPYELVFVPFRLREESAYECRCSIGGLPPIGILPPHVDSHTRYLATLGLEEGTDVSLYSTFDYSTEDTPFSFFRESEVLHDETNSLVQFVVHKPVVGRAELPTKSELPRLGFVFGDSKLDPVSPTLESTGNQRIYAGHKIGGIPYFSQIVEEMDVVPKILTDGYEHLLQLSVPSNEDSVIHVDWPFGESVFHVFAKKLGGGFSFRYIWA